MLVRYNATSGENRTVNDTLTPAMFSCGQCITIIGEINDENERSRQTCPEVGFFVTNYTLVSVCFVEAVLLTTKPSVYLLNELRNTNKYCIGINEK